MLMLFLFIAKEVGHEEIIGCKLRGSEKLLKLCIPIVIKVGSDFYMSVCAYFFFFTIVLILFLFFCKKNSVRKIL